MRWPLAITAVAVSGCGFRISGGVAGDGSIDEDAAIDVLPDVPADTPPDMPPDMPIDMGPADQDSDGVPDATDNCVAAPNAGQQDFDGDAMGDPCDPCPHLSAASEPDGDLDGIGDRCDPRPAQAGDTRVIWQPLYDASHITTWTQSNMAGNWIVPAGRLIQSDDDPALAVLDSPMTYGNVYFATEIMLLGSLDGNDEIGVCGGHVPVSTQYYCCAINNGSVRATNLWQGAGFIRSSSLPWDPNQTAGAMISIEGRMDTLTTSCTFRQGSTTVTPLPAARGPVVPGSAVFYTANMPGSWRYLFVVAIGA